MTTERLFEFLVLSQTLSYSKAAKKLFITQSALSRHIIDMEEELGVTLLERSTHSVRLTQAGRILAQRSRHLMQKSGALMDRLRTAGIQTGGSISIACLESVARGQLMIFLTAFAAKYPDVDLRVDVLSEENHLAVIDLYDFTFTAFELQNLPPDVKAKLTFRSPGILRVLGEFGQSHHIGLEELVGKTLFVPYADEMFCSYANNRQLAEKLTGYRVNVVRVPTAESAMMMAALGRGVTIVPQHMPESTVTNVLSIDISTPGCVFDTYMYWNSGRTGPAARLMLEEIDSFARQSGLE
ncbi:MAG: LysR family transcriptional regulator [Oscillospiraceae bacterium]